MSVKKVNPSRATFRALVEIAIGLRRGDCTTDICGHCRESEWN